MLKKEYLHFSFPAENFNWLIRHLWIEGSEHKAVAMWRAAFPNMGSIKYLKGFFLDLVSGRKKFIDNDDGSYDLVKDGSRYWKRDRENEDESYPLLDSWSDVILKKKTKLFVEELELWRFRVLRLPCKDDIDVRQGMAVQSRVASLHAELMNYQEFLDDPIDKYLLPPFGGARYASDVWDIISPIKEYFQKKYGTPVIFYTRGDIDDICNLPNFQWSGDYDVKSSKLQESIMSSYKPIDVDQYVSERIAMSNRKTIESEDPALTEWNSGYIARDGKFYGCGQTDHINFAPDLCEALDIDIEDEDAQQVLDDKGFVKVSMRRFDWDTLNCRVTKAQQRTIVDLMNHWDMAKAQINSYEPVTLQEALEDLML